MSNSDRPLESSRVRSREKRKLVVVAAVVTVAYGLGLLSLREAVQAGGEVGKAVVVPFFLCVAGPFYLAFLLNQYFAHDRRRYAMIGAALAPVVIPAGFTLVLHPLLSLEIFALGGLLGMLVVFGLSAGAPGADINSIDHGPLSLYGIAALLFGLSLLCAKGLLTIVGFRPLH